MEIVFKSQIRPKNLLHLNDVLAPDPLGTLSALVYTIRDATFAPCFTEEHRLFLRSHLQALQIQETLFRHVIKNLTVEWVPTSKQKAIIHTAYHGYADNRIEGAFYKYGGLYGIVALLLVFKDTDSILTQFRAIEVEAAQQFLISNVSRLFRNQGNHWIHCFVPQERFGLDEIQHLGRPSQTLGKRKIETKDSSALSQSQPTSILHRLPSRHKDIPSPHSLREARPLPTPTSTTCSPNLSTKVHKGHDNRGQKQGQQTYGASPIQEPSESQYEPASDHGYPEALHHCIPTPTSNTSSTDQYSSPSQHRSSGHRRNRSHTSDAIDTPQSIQWQHPYEFNEWQSAPPNSGAGVSMNHNIPASPLYTLEYPIILASSEHMQHVDKDSLSVYHPRSVSQPSSHVPRHHHDVDQQPRVSTLTSDTWSQRSGIGTISAVLNYDNDTSIAASAPAQDSLQTSGDDHTKIISSVAGQQSLDMAAASGIETKLDSVPIPQRPDAAPVGGVTTLLRAIQFEKRTLQQMVLERPTDILGGIWLCRVWGYPPFISLRLPRALDIIVKPSGQEVYVPQLSPDATMTDTKLIKFGYFKQLIQRDGFGIIFWNECGDEAFVTMEVTDERLVADFVRGAVPD